MSAVLQSEHHQRLALLGGKPLVSAATSPFQPFNTMADEEVHAVTDVVRSGVLSAYIGAPGPGFMGGEQVRLFEQEAAEYFEVKHAIAVNSWTSGLIAAVGAIGIEPGDEIITTPWTMAATATAILHWAGIPVFADIDPQTFNLSPAAVEPLITKRTKAIIAVDIFGQSADMAALRALADRYGLKLLCDTAQAPGALTHTSAHHAVPTGTLADIGGYSLNYHKHIHCGEGGILVTNDDHYARRLCLIRNHAEAVIQSDDPHELANMLGFNFRMGEMEAAIARCQLKKLATRVETRQAAAARLHQGLQDLPGLTTPAVMRGNTHAYYMYGLLVDPTVVGVSRSRLAQALRAEGLPSLAEGYQNLHLLPMFRHKIAYGTQGFPWRSPYCEHQGHYGPGLCPVAEDYHRHRFLALNLCMFEFGQAETDAVIAIFHKVWSQREALRDLPC